MRGLDLSSSGYKKLAGPYECGYKCWGLHKIRGMCLSTEEGLRSGHCLLQGVTVLTMNTGYFLKERYR